MITGISIKNFKGIGETGIDIELAPVTMLFGSNNAGKSSVFHAFILADQIFNEGNRNPSRIGPEGSTIDLGGFESFVHDKVLDREVTLTFRLDLSREKIDQEWPIEETLVELHGRPGGVDLSAIGDDVWKGEVSIQLAWDKNAKTAFVRRYSISLNDEHLGDIESPGNRKVVYLSNVNPAHSLLRWPDDRSWQEVGSDSYGVLDGLATDFQVLAVRMLNSSEQIGIQELPSVDDGDGYLVFAPDAPMCELQELGLFLPERDLNELSPSEQERLESIVDYPELIEFQFFFGRYADGQIRLVAVRYLGALNSDIDDEMEYVCRTIRDLFHECNQQNSSIEIDVLSDALPNWHEPIRFKFLLVELPEFATVAPSIRLVTELLNRLLVVPGRILARELRRFRHIGPLRRTPNRAYRRSTVNDRHSWSEGLAAWDSLLRSKSLTDSVSSWIHRKDQLAMGYEIDFQEFREVPLESPISRCLTDSESIDLDTLQLAAELFADLPTRTRLQFRLDSTQVCLDPQDLAIGLNQLLPVVVAALDDHVGLTLIEQPELHNHPSVEVGLGDLFAQTIRDKTCRFVLETHGEHLLLRMLRRIRETSDGELPNGIPPLEPESIAVYFIANDADGVSAKRLRIDQTGEFIDNWPGGFFRERAGELF